MKVSLKLLNRSSAGRGFSLIELLVVIAIIGILAALLSPTLSRAKGAAKSVACKNNLRQVGIGLRLYVDEFHAYPLYNNNKAERGGYWRTALSPYFGGDGFRLWRCPNAKANLWWGDIYDYNSVGTDRRKLWWNNWDPSINPNSTLGLGMLGSVDVAVAESVVLAPSDMLALGELFGFFSGLELNHDSIGNNAVFCDGHVETSPLFSKPDEARAKRLNNDNEPHPETWVMP